MESDGATPTFFLDELRDAGRAARRTSGGARPRARGPRLRHEARARADVQLAARDLRRGAARRSPRCSRAVQFNCALVLSVPRASRSIAPATASSSSTELLVDRPRLDGASRRSASSRRATSSGCIAYASINHAGVIAIGLGHRQVRVVRRAALRASATRSSRRSSFSPPARSRRTTARRTRGEVAGLIKDLPYSGLFLMVGTFALLGFPPFGSFLGELLILSGARRARADRSSSSRSACSSRCPSSRPAARSSR